MISRAHKLAYAFSFRIFCIAFFAAAVCSTQIRSETNSREDVESLTHETFRVREITKYIFDGSEVSSSIAWVSHVSNEFVFAGDAGWRVKRQLPISEVTREYVFFNGDKESRPQRVTPTNRAINLREEFNDEIWTGILISPLRIAQQWSLAPSGISLKSWLNDIKTRTSPMKNTEGDEIKVESLSDNGVRIILRGSLLVDAKTKLRMESTWTLSDLDKINAEDLKKPLVRSNS